MASGGILAEADALAEGRRFTPHGLRHTFATLHLAAGTPPKWIQAQGGWRSATMLWDRYGHFLPTETHGHANALGVSTETALDGTGPNAAVARCGTLDENRSEDEQLNGADERSRTADLLITNQLLYQLSYVGPGSRAGREGRTS